MESYHIPPFGTKTGTTASEYADVVTIEGYGGAIFEIKNLDLSATMYYKITGYRSTDPAALPIAIKAETNIAGNTVVENTDANTPFARITISVKNHSGPCAYQVDWIGT